MNGARDAIRRARALAVSMALAMGGAVQATPASAAPLDKQACVDAATRGQIQRDDLKLNAAAEAFALCADASCPVAVRTSCTEWLADVRSRIPSVTVRLVDGPSDGATLLIDGAAASFDKPQALDPGPHAVRIETANGAPVTRSFSLAASEKTTLELGLHDS